MSRSISVPSERGSIHPLAVQSQYDEWQIIEALREARGNLSACARKLELKRRALSDRVYSTPELKEVMEEARNGIIDAAEENIYLAVEAKDLEASKFVLRTIGKTRGYTYGTEISGDPERPLFMDNKVEIVGVVPKPGSSK